MTLNDKKEFLPLTQKIIDREFPFFMTWFIRYGIERLFQERDEENPFLIKLYLLSKNMGQDVYRILMMPPDLVDDLYALEKQLLPKEDNDPLNPQ